MKNILKNKAFIILAMLIITLFFYTSKSFAGYEQGDMPDIDFDMLGFSLDDGYCLINNNNLMNIVVLPHGFEGKLIYDGSSIYLSDGSKYLINELKSDGKWNNPILWDRNNNIFNIYYSTFDIYDTAGNVVFQKTPVVQGILAEVVTLEEAQEIPATIVGLAGLLIALLVCLIGFRKGWNRLSRILHKA